MEELFKGFGWQVTMEEARLPDGRTKKAVRVHRCDTAHILAFPTDHTILLLHEFRPFYGAYVWMLPSGHADKETDILTTAQRELREETGFSAKILEPYGQVHGTEAVSITNHLFIARELSPSPLPQDEDELIEVHEVSLNDAIEKVLSSKFIHTPSAFALLKYEREHRT